MPGRSQLKNRELRRPVSFAQNLQTYSKNRDL